jgi:hypothetical protein
MEFDERHAYGREFEWNLLRDLNGTGWTTDRFNLCPEHCRRELKRSDYAGLPSRFRWVPDLITYHRFPDGENIVRLIDAKRPWGANYAVEIACVETAELIIQHFHTPVFYVFNDGTVMTPEEVREFGVEGPLGNNGSNRPWLKVLKVPKRFRQIKDVFPDLRTKDWENK